MALRVAKFQWLYPSKKVSRSGKVFLGSGERISFF